VTLPSQGWRSGGKRVRRVAVVAVLAAIVASCIPGDAARSSSATLVITRGGTYSGTWESRDSATPAVIVRTSEPVVIQDSVIRSAGHLIRTEYGRNTHLTIRNVYGEALYPTTQGSYPGRFLLADTYRHIVVEHVHMERTSGIWLHRSTQGATVQIRDNVARDIDGRRSDGRGAGWPTSSAPSSCSSTRATPSSTAKSPGTR
jgi:hypothetical protein